MRNWVVLAVSVVVMSLGTGTALAQGGVPTPPPVDELPRADTLILHNPEGTVRNAGWFNIWADDGGGRTTGLAQLMMDTLWYVDPQEGLDGAVYDSLAAGSAEYNAGFTQMTVRLREGVRWSDGEPFDADDLVFTVETQMTTPGLAGSEVFSEQVARVEKLDDLTVRFHLRAPNSRFHAIFSAHRSAAWIMPEHVLAEVEDIAAYDFNPPVGLGPYRLYAFDPNGAWYIWEKREDWNRTAMAGFGEPAPQFVVYRDGGSAAHRLAEIGEGNLDMAHDLAPEDMLSILDQDEDVRGWSEGFPYAPADPALSMVTFNHQNATFQDRRVRWALALMLDAPALSLAGYDGLARLSAIAVPPAGGHPLSYHGPMQQWLTAYELDTGAAPVRPYDPELTLELAEMARPLFGDEVPTDTQAIRAALGHGWWAQNLEAAAELLVDAGFTRQGGGWTTPDGAPFAVAVTVPPTGPFNRLGAAVAEQWSAAGVQATTQVAFDARARQVAGGYEAGIAWWPIETWGGHPDLGVALEGWHSRHLAGGAADANPMRWRHERLDSIVDAIRAADPDHPRTVVLGRLFAQLVVEEMPVIPLMSLSAFPVVSERYWTGYPTAESPYARPAGDWPGLRYILPRLEPTGRSEAAPARR